MKINTDNLKNCDLFSPNRYSKKGRKELRAERKKKEEETRQLRHQKRSEKYVFNGQKKALAKAAVRAVLRKAKAERHQKLMQRHASRFGGKNDSNESSLPVGSDRGQAGDQGAG